MLSRYEYLELLAPRIKDELIITTISGIRREWYNLQSRDGNLYHVYMSGAAAVALGLATALPHRRVLCLDGDGSMLMALSILPAIARRHPANLTVIVMDNELYEACSLATFTSGGMTNLAGMAKEAGIPHTALVCDGEEFTMALDRAYQADATTFIQVKVKPGHPLLANAPFQGVENKYRFIRYVEETENIRILKPEALKAKGRQGEPST